jgi:hypothetical protein
MDFFFYGSTAVYGPGQRPLPDNTQHSQQTDIHAPGGIRTQILVSERPKTHVLDRAATGIGKIRIYEVKVQCYLLKCCWNVQNAE